MRKIISFLVMAGLLSWQVPAMAGYQMTPRQAFYYHAHKGNLSALQKLKSMGHSINMTDQYGNSALCESVYRQDYSAFAMLKQVGATTAHQCVSRIPQQTIQQFNQGYANWAQAVNSGKIAYAGATTQAATTTAATAGTMGTMGTATVATTTGLSTAAMVGIGVGAAALVGGIALAAGGGGGGGSSSSAPAACSGHGSKDTEGKCQCYTGYTGENCADCAENYGTYGTNTCHLTKGCNTAHGSQKGDSCVCNAGWTGDELCNTATTCGTNYVASCPTGYTHSKTCKSGDDTLYLCDTCDANYVKIDGVCVVKMTCNNHGQQIGDGVCDCDTGYAGNQCNTCDTGNGYVQSGSICVIPGTCSADYNLTTPPDSNKANYETCTEETPNKYRITSCKGNWTNTANGCNTCSLSPETKVDSNTCECINGYTLINGSCISSSGGNTSGNNYLGMDSGVKILWEDRTVPSNKTYVNSENVIVTSLDMLVPLPEELREDLVNKGKNILDEEQCAMAWIENHAKEGELLFSNQLTQEEWQALTLHNGNDEDVSVQFYPLLYAAEPGISGGNIVFKNEAYVTAGPMQINEQSSNPGYSYDNRIQYGFFYGVNFWNTGNIAYTKEAEGLDGPWGFTSVYSVGAPLWVKNEGNIAGSMDINGLDGKISVNNTGFIDSLSLLGNVEAINSGNILVASIDGGASLTNSGVVDNLTIGNGTFTNEIGGIIKNEAIGPYETTILGNATIINKGTINGDIVVYKYIGNRYTENTEGYHIENYYGIANPKANLTFVNNGTFSGQLITIASKEELLSHSGMNEVSLQNYGTYVVPNSVNLSNINYTIHPNSLTQFEGNALGNINISSDFVMNNSDTTVVAKDMIQTPDASKLNLISESALFDAKLADNGSDVVMTMKGFDTATSNNSLAQFLTTNYALGNNEAFFNKLKSFGNMSALTDSLNKLTGKDMLSRFNFEDMTMMRELNFDMNEKLFHNKEQHFALAGSVSPMAFRGDTGSNARYSLFNKRDGNTSIGLGIAFTNVRSDDTHEDNNRRETSYQLILPMGYKTHGFNLMTSPRIGYARGTYDRTGFDEKTYDGTIEKRVFGLMNEARYPITLGKWKFEPSAEFNILGYQQKGHEDDKDYALNIQSQNTLSVEGGIGLYATREEELDKDTTLKLTAGMAAYHEFADPYRVKVGMHGMDGAFTLRDENRSDNRGVIRAGFDYVYRDLSLYGSLISYIDRETRTSAKTGMKLKF